MRKGFTLVELLAVLIIISVIALITTSIISGTVKKAKEKSYLNQITLIESAAERWTIENSYIVENSMKNNGYAGVSLTELYEGGYIKNETVNDPRTNEPLEGKVAIENDAANNQYRYTYTSANLLTGGTAEVTKAPGVSRAEFIQFADLAPIIDEYGLVPYTISFDIKSANISNSSQILVHCQNGSYTKYSFNVLVPVTTNYVRKSITVTPVISKATETRAMLAFYGTYGTGNIPSVRNVKVELGSVATPFAG